MTFVSYAQNFEDVMLWRAFKSVSHGVYIDVGAQDPVADSVSRAFHDAGWHGIHVEPSAHFAALLRAARPGDVVIQAAVSDVAGVLPFFEIAGTGLSTIDPEIAAGHTKRSHTVTETCVPSITLESVFATCKFDTIHWLKLDIERAERQALLSWGPTTYRPLVVVVESTLPMSQVENSREWEYLLLERGYAPVYFDGLNRFYVVEERPDLKALLSVPPNVFDGFAVSGLASSQVHMVVEARLRAEGALVARACASAEHELTSLREQMERVQAAAERDAAVSAEALKQTASDLAQLRQLHAESLTRIEQLNLRSNAAVQTLADARTEHAVRIADMGQALLRAMQDASEERNRATEQHRGMLQELQTSTMLRVSDTVRRADEAVAAAAARLAMAEDHAKDLDARLESERHRSHERAERAMSEVRHLEGELSQSRIRQQEAESALQAANNALAQTGQEVIRSQLSLAAAETRLGMAEDRAKDLDTRLESERHRYHTGTERAISEIRHLEGELSRSRMRHIETESALQAANAALEQTAQEVVRSRLLLDRLSEALLAAEQDARDVRRELDKLKQQASADATALVRETDARLAAEAAIAATEERLVALVQRGNALAADLQQQVDAAQLRIIDAERAVHGLEAQAEQTAAAHALATANSHEAFAARLQAMEAEQAQVVAALQAASRQADGARTAEIASLQQDLARRSAEFNVVAAELAQATGSLQSLRASAFGRLLSLFGQFPEPLQAPSHTPSPPASIVPGAAVSGPSFQASSAGAPTAPPRPPETPVLDKLLVLDDLDFVYAAYRTALKREPDPTGERNYVELMRSGVDKVVVLAALLGSEEGQKAGVVIPGLAAAVRRQRLARLPVLGPLLSGLLGLLRPAPALDPARAFVSQSIGLHHAVRAMLGQVQASVEDIRQRQERMESTVRRLGERQDEVGASIAAMQARVLSLASHGETAGGAAEAVALQATDGITAPHALRLELLRKASAWKT